MKKAVSVFMLVLLTLCACTPARKAEMPSYYTAELNGQAVSVAPFLYYADFNRLFYSFLEKSLGDRFDEVVYDTAVSDFLTYYIILDEAAERGLVLSEEELSLLEEDYQAYLQTRENEYLSEDEVRTILSVYYYQERIVDAFEVPEKTVENAFLAEYSRFRYCFVGKNDENGQKYSSEALDERKEKAYNIYASVCDGTLTMSDAVKRFSDEYVNVELYAGDDRTEVERENEILSETGFLVDSDGYTDYSIYAIPTDVLQSLRDAEVGTFFFVENDAGFWICEKMNPIDLLDDKREAVLDDLRTEMFSVWLDEKQSALSYELNQQMVDEYIYSRP